MAHQASPSSARAPFAKDVWGEREGSANAILGTFAPEWVRSRDFFQPRLHGSRKFDALPDGQRSSDLASPCSLSLKQAASAEVFSLKLVVSLSRACVWSVFCILLSSFGNAALTQLLVVDYSGLGRGKIIQSSDNAAPTSR